MSTCTGVEFRSSPELQRLQVFNGIAFFIIVQPKFKPGVVAVHHVQKRLESPVVIVSSLVFLPHEKAAFVNEQTCEIIVL